MGLFDKEKMDKKENERRQKLIKKLSQFKTIGYLRDITSPKDLDYLYEQGWELIASSSDYGGWYNFYFKKILIK